MSLLNPYLENIKTLCKEHKVASLYLFGSATGMNFNKNSDIDFLVAFHSMDLSDYFYNYISLKNSLKELLHREIDLLEEQTLKNPILINAINQNKQLIYGSENFKMAL